MQRPLLSVQNLSIDFQKSGEMHPAVEDISFDILPGEVVALVGESGSGKTITSLSILQLLDEAAIISKGSIYFSENGTHQVDLLNLTDKDIRKIRGNKISMIFQEPMTSLNPVKTCGDQVLEAITTHQKMGYASAKKKVIELFHQVQLPEPETIFKRYPHQISGGQKQRVMISMAISCNPALLIADEPTTALDVTVQKSILELIKQFQEKDRMGVLFITHDLELVSEFADKVVVLYQGKIVELGSIKDIFNHPQHPYTKALLMCRPGQNPKGKKLPVISDFLPSNGMQAATVPTLNFSEIESKNEVRSDTNTYLEIKDLTVTFPTQRNFFGRVVKSFTALDHINLNILKGETIGLVGESGSGKSTLGKTIMGMIKPAKGIISLNGKSVFSQKNRAHAFSKEIQIVFQDPYGSLNPRISIGETIAEPMAVHNHFSRKIRKEKAIHLLEKVKLSPDVYNRYPHEFSGGQRQRICIARALSIAPNFIIFDESVSALDVSIQAEVLNLIEELKKELSFTCIFISHDLRVVRYISDRIVVMHQGKIVEVGNTEKIFQHPQQEYTKMLLNAMPGNRPESYFSN